MNNLSTLLSAAAKVELPLKQLTASNSPLSFSIVNSSNGKRLRFSKSLVEALGLEDTAEIAPVPDQSCILIAKKLPMDNVLLANLKPDGERRVSYTATSIQALTKLFTLNFSEHSSMSFQKITLDKLEDGTPVAITEIFNKYPKN